MNQATRQVESMAADAAARSSGGPGSCDVVVIGGGPSRSAAALLARPGLGVPVLEKDRHPRFHTGESLLQANLPLFERPRVRSGMSDADSMATP